MSASFIHFAASHGVDISPHRLDTSGKIKRCGTAEHPNSRNGAYLFDGRGGWVWAWDGAGRAMVWNDPDAKPMTDLELSAHNAKRMAFRDEALHHQKVAAQWAARLLSLAKPGEHAYLKFKGLKEARGLVLPDGELFIPMRDVSSNELLGAQIVQWLPEQMRWEKKYLYGMRSKGAVQRLGPQRVSETIFVEGMATGLSVLAAVQQMRLSAAVLVTFSAHNLKHCATRTTGRRYVIADHDAPQRDPEKAKQNAGEQGQRAAISTGLGWAMAETEGFDANDEHVQNGLMAVCALVMRARQAEPAKAAEVA